MLIKNVHKQNGTIIPSGMWTSLEKEHHRTDDFTIHQFPSELPIRDIPTFMLEMCHLCYAAESAGVAQNHRDPCGSFLHSLSLLYLIMSSPLRLKQGITRSIKLLSSVEWNDFTLARCISISSTSTSSSTSILHNVALCLVARNSGYFLILFSIAPDLN